MSLLYDLPALLRVALVFVLILLAIRRRMTLGSAFIVGSIGLSILFGLDARRALGSALSAIVFPETLALALIVTLILILSDSMDRAGQMRRLLEKFRGLVSNQGLNLVMFPALIGLLPMPGGAVFSAPMVREMGRYSRLGGQHLSFVNYWFRHIWEYWWPMYPGVLLASVIAGINLPVFVVLMLPLSIAAVYLGRHPLGGLNQTVDDVDGGKRPALGPFLRELMPILIVIFPGLGMGALFMLFLPAVPMGKELGLVLSLCMAVGWTWYANGFTWTQKWQTLRNPQLLKMVYMVLAILIFKGILSDSQGVKAISEELSRLRIPLVLIAVSLPLIVGVLTGITIAFVGSTFPILIPLVHTHGESQAVLAYVMVALVSGFSGVLLSPLHLCMILSNEYFGTSPGPVYRQLWAPCMYLIIIGFCYFWVLRSLFH